MKKTAVAFVLMASLLHGRNVGGWIVSSLGEAPYRFASDMGGSIPLPQIGIGLDYPTRFLTPFNELTLGWYNAGPFFENYAGIHAGYRIKGVMPGFTVGVGIQSSNEKQYWYSDTATYSRKLRYPWGLGLRADFFRKAYGEFEQRSEGGYPFWRAKFGIRIL